MSSKLTQFKKGHIPWSKNNKFSDVTRKKMSDAKKRNPPNNLFKKGHKPYCAMKGKHLSDSAKKMISDKKRGNCNKNQWGENNPFWKGGTTPENKRIRNTIDFRLWREAVFARDNWTCQKYGIRGGVLHPHHIQNFADHPELRFAIDNGITLSEKAHKEFHKIYGARNNTRSELEDFLKN